MVLAWVITASFYTLASLGSQGKMPPRFLWFLGGIVVISLLMHFAIQRWAPFSSEVLLPIATLLNGIGYVEIARWNPTFARDQSLWFLLSAIGLVARLDGGSKNPGPRSLPVHDPRRGDWPVAVAARSARR